MYDISKALEDNVSMRYLQQKYRNLQSILISVLQELTGSPSTVKNTKGMLRRFFDEIRPDMKGRYRKELEDLNQCLWDCVSFIFTNGTKEKPVSDDLLSENGYGNNEYKELLWKFAEFASEALGEEIPDDVATYCGHNPDARNVLTLDQMRSLGAEALIKNETPSRVPLAFVIDNGFYLSQFPGGMEMLNSRLLQLFSELNGTDWIRVSTDMYITTTGCGPNGYVREENERVAMASVNVLYDDVLKHLDIAPKGKSYIVPAIRAAIQALQDIIREMRECPTPVRPFRPWLVVLTNGGFRDSEEDIAALAEELRTRVDSHNLMLQIQNITDISPEAMAKVERLGTVNKDRKIEEFFAMIHQSFRSFSGKTPDYEINMTYS